MCATNHTVKKVRRQLTECKKVPDKAFTSKIHNEVFQLSNKKTTHLKRGQMISMDTSPEKRYTWPINTRTGAQRHWIRGSANQATVRCRCTLTGLRRTDEGFPGGAGVKTLPASAGTQVRSLAWEDSACLRATKPVSRSC